MTYLRVHHKKIVAGVFIVLLFALLAAVPVLADECERGLLQCGIDAAISGLFGGIQNGLIYFSGCLIGYEWCLEYYE